MPIKINIAETQSFFVGMKNIWTLKSMINRTHKKQMIM